MRAGGDLGADFGRVRIHRLGADAGQDERGPDAAIRAHGAEQVGRTVALVAWRARPAALVGPDISRVPCCPTRASSCHQISSGLPRACSGTAARTSSAKFFYALPALRHPDWGVAGGPTPGENQGDATDRPPSVRPASRHTLERSWPPDQCAASEPPRL